MRKFLGNQFPLDTILRWWYVVSICPLIGLTLGLSGWDPFSTKDWVHKEVTPDWVNYIFSTCLGGLVSVGIIWLLEEIRTYPDLSESTDSSETPDLSKTPDSSD